MEKSWHQKKRESLWSAGHQYSLWAPPLTFRFVAKPICLDLSRVLPRVAFGPPALGFPPNLSQSPNPPILNWRHNHPTETKTIIIIITIITAHYLRHYTFTKALFIDWIVQRWLAAATNWSHWDIWRGIDWNEGNIYQTINVIIKYYWSCYLNVSKNRRNRRILHHILNCTYVLDESFCTKLFLAILTFPQLVSDLYL